MFRRAVAPLLVAVVAALAGGCGNGAAGFEPAATPAAADDTDADRRVIAAWADALRRSDVDRAAGYFALPVVVQQSEAVRLRTRAQVRQFNASLPCGARLESVAREGGYVVGTFRLTERPGRRCDAPGEDAKVAFRFEDGRFTEWRQLPERAPDGEPPADADPV